jgi:hypothetical protein
MMHRTHMGVDNDWQSFTAARHAQRPVRRLGRVYDRHRGVRHPVRRAPTPRSPNGQFGRPESRPGQHRGSRPQPGGVGDGFPGLPVDRIAGSGQCQRRRRHQPGGRLLHGQRTAHAPRHRHGRQPPDDRVDPLHRRRGHDDRGLPVHHALGGQGGRPVTTPR